MTVSKRGPKTESGKKQSAKNSTTHGARSQAITNAKEQVHFDSFLKELIDFYQPQGPIEQYQLERIATCKAKLKSLYELEQAKLALLIDQHQANKNKYIDDFPGLTTLVRGMVKEWFLIESLGLTGQVFLPCQLTAESLSDIVAEIDFFHGVLTSDDDLRDYFPQLSEYLEGIDSNETSLHGRLMGISHQLENIVNEDGYHEAVKLLFCKKSKKVKAEPTPEELEFDRQLELYQEQVRKRHGLKPRVVVKDPPVQFPNEEKLLLAFKVFKTINNAYLVTQEKVERVRSFIELHQRALSLPNDEADLLMRYQTSWERRLSTLIGEFVQLQKMRVADEAAKLMLQNSKK